MKRTPVIISLGTLYLLLLVCVAFAHSVVLWAYVENGAVHVEAFTPNGTKIKDAQLVIIDKAGKVLLEGITDREGAFTFDPPIKDEMTIVMVIDDAHKAEFKIMAEDFEEQ
jgi:nickel transport protein